MDRFEDAKLLVDGDSSLQSVTLDRDIALHPMFLGDLKEGIRDFLDREKNLYSERFDGVVLCYGNIKHYGSAAFADPEIGCTHHRIRVDFIVFKPQIGSQVTAVVNKIGKDYIGCLVHNRFNASVLKSEIPSDAVEVGQEVLLQIKEVVSNGRMLSLKGSLVGDRFGMKEKKKKKKKNDMSEDHRPKIPEEDSVVSKKTAKRKRSLSESEENQAASKKQHVAGSEKSKRHSAGSGIAQSPDSGGSGVASVNSDELFSPVDISPRTPPFTVHKHKKKKRRAE